ncbi:trypsin-like peptidase domain-containing protein [Pseudomonas pergaminensis]|uniref:trypsin-like peptidase domain-containing protein n=1 Tax=Pseudomonas pergaminensis TaxID=2853159 RepID=UPI0034D77730
MYRKIENAIYATGTEIVKFFAIDVDNLGSAKNLGMLCQLNDEWENHLDVAHLVLSCENLVRAGVLLELSSGSNTYERVYAAVNYNEIQAAYGEYDFLAEGFGEIAKKLGHSVLPIIVEKTSGDEDLGSAFLLGNPHTILTARHVVENMTRLRVLGPNGSGVEIHNIYVSLDENIDIAVLEVTFAESNNLTALRTGRSEILNEVLSIGFPPIPGFDAVRVYDKSEINSYVRYSKGRIVSEATSYLDKQDFILFNARVKGGNSGGPILNARGLVMGMLVQIPMAIDDSRKIDALGYGVAVPHESILNALTYPTDGRKLKLRHISNYEYSTAE